jgi:hypothetical protein
MDPFLEAQEWGDFRTRFNTVISDLLLPRVATRYVVRVERRVYIESPGDDLRSFRGADVAVLWSSGTDGGTALAVEPATSLEPFECELPMPEERRETYRLNS